MRGRSRGLGSCCGWLRRMAGGAIGRCQGGGGACAVPRCSLRGWRRHLQWLRLFSLPRVARRTSPRCRRPVTSRLGLGKRLPGPPRCSAVAAGTAWAPNLLSARLFGSRRACPRCQRVVPGPLPLPPQLSRFSAVQEGDPGRARARGRVDRNPGDLFPGWDELLGIAAPLVGLGVITRSPFHQ